MGSEEGTSFVLQDPLLILNDSLKYNSSLKLCFNEFQCHFQLFLSTLLCLRKNPNFLVKNALRRSRSLCHVNLYEEFQSSALSSTEGINNYFEEEDDQAASPGESCTDVESTSEYGSPLVERFEDLSLDKSTSSLETSCFSYSCPDLSNLEAIQDMHPVLYDVLTKCLVLPPSNLPSPYKNATVCE